MTVVAVNGRFLTQPQTGVQRVALEYLRHLPGEGVTVVLLEPGEAPRTVRPGDAVEVRERPEWWGGRGHLWEQTTLRREAARARADLLLGVAGWGPLGSRRLVPIIYDIHPITFPEHFAPWFVRWCKVAMPVLARVSPAVLTMAGAVRRQLVDRLGARPGRVHLVPGGVGAPFTTRSLDDLAQRPGGYCLLLGGDKSQKNLAFLMGFWEQVHRELGLELVVTERPIGTRVAATADDAPWLRRVHSPADDELAELFAGARFLVSPSLAEGYNLPLLEAMAVGTPFLASDTGAARELAVDEAGQVLPLEPQAWIDALRRLGGDAGALLELRRASAERARAMTWARAGDRLRELLVEVAG